MKAPAAQQVVTSTRRSVRPRERGVTLIELMIATAIAGIAMAVMASSMFLQQDSYYRHLDAVQAQQNARASIAMLKRYLRQAGWGLKTRADATGIAVLGRCHDTVNPERESTNCNNVDLGHAGVGASDRLRVVLLDATSDDLATADTGTNQHDDTLQTYTLDPTYGTAATGIPNNAYAVISGACDAGPPDFGIDLLQVSGCGTPPCELDTNVQTATSVTTCGRYADGFSFGRATVADFFIDRTQPARPKLMLQIRDDSTPLGAYVVARDVDDFQVQYGIDTTASTDGVVDVWCDDPNDAVTDCPLGLAGGAAEQVARIVAVRVAIVPRTARIDPDRVAAVTTRDVLGNADNVINFEGDGYRRWIYRATVALRNTEQ